MKNRTFKHRELLKENDLKTTDIPDKLLQQRIRGFDELVEDYEHTVDEDREQMQNQLIQLDLELEEDLYELYDEQLDNNDDIEEAPKKIEPKIEQQVPIEIESYDIVNLSSGGYSITEHFTDGSKKNTKLSKETIDWVNEEYEGTLSNVGAKKLLQKERSIKKNIVPTKPINKDEAILEKLIKNGYSSINRVNLRKLGFEAVLEDNRHHVGKYILTKAAFNYTFKYHIAINPNLKKDE